MPNLFTTNAKFLSMMQTGYLDRKFQAPLYAETKFRSEFTRAPWDTDGIHTFKTRRGAMAVNLQELALGVDPTPGDFPIEQWPVTIGRRAGAQDALITANRFSLPGVMLQKLDALAENAGTVLDLSARQALFNAALAGQSRVDSAAESSTEKHVDRINGFTHQFTADGLLSPVSPSNPKPIAFREASAWVQRNVIGVTPDTARDENGPGTLLLSVAYTTTAKQPVVALDASMIVRSGGGFSVDDIGSTDLMTIALIRAAVSRLKSLKIPRFADGCYHAHLSTNAVSQLRQDQEFRDLFTGSKLDAGNAANDPYQNSRVAVLEGCIIYENDACPAYGSIPAIYGADGGRLSAMDTNTAGQALNHSIVVGAGNGVEYWDSPLAMPDELQGNVMGRVGSWNELPNGMQADLFGVQVVFRGPTNREQSDLSLLWSFYGSHSIGTDYNSPRPGAAYNTMPAGSKATYKRAVVIQHAAT
jgi:hypothetical protein